jgi:hypothetical protein
VITLVSIAVILLNLLSILTTAKLLKQGIARLYTEKTPSIL